MVVPSRLSRGICVQSQGVRFLGGWPIGKLDSAFLGGRRVSD